MPVRRIRRRAAGLASSTTQAKPALSAEEKQALVDDVRAALYLLAERMSNFRR